MGFGEALQVGFRKAFDFNGRASQREFWFFYLWMLIIQTAVTTIFVIVISLTVVAAAASAEASPNDTVAFGAVGASVFLYLLLFLVLFALAVPLYASEVRRLHDTGQSGWFVAFNFASLGIVPLIMCIFEGQPHENQWGPVPQR